MVWVTLTLAFIAYVIGNCIYYKSDDERIYGPAEVVKYSGACIAIISLVSSMVLFLCVSGLSVIDDKIAMYQEENAKIEEQIAAVVAQYQEYESDIFDSVAPESAVTLVALYPDLKSDTLVQKQIEVYLENNEKIKELKEEKIGGSVLRWWLYFGG